MALLDRVAALVGRQGESATLRPLAGGTYTVTVVPPWERRSLLPGAEMRVASMLDTIIAAKGLTVAPLEGDILDVAGRKRSVTSVQVLRHKGVTLAYQLGLES